MPYKLRISDLDSKIEALRATLQDIRESRGTKAEQEKLLAKLARLKAERTRLMMRQIQHDMAAK